MMDKIVIEIYLGSEYEGSTEYICMNADDKDIFVLELEELLGKELKQWENDRQLLDDYYAKKPVKVKRPSQHQQKAYETWDASEPNVQRLHERKFEFTGYIFPLDNFIAYNREKKCYSINMPNIYTLDEWFNDNHISNFHTYYKEKLDET